MAQTKKIAVLGSGSWGTALALVLARNGFDVSLWGHRAEHLEQIRADGVNKLYLPEFPFPNNLATEADLSQLVKKHHQYLLVIPSKAFRETIDRLKAAGLPEDSTIIWGTKGFDPQNQDLLSDVIINELGNNINHGIVSGPSFSKEVAANLPTALTVAANNIDIAKQAAKWFHNDRMRVYTNNDLVGVQVGGAIKNVMAIAAGISDGLGFGANSRAALITRGLTEITRLGVKLGAQAETFFGLAGLGDLVLTCTDNQSRNRRFGLGLGQGKSPEQVLKEIGQEVEGLFTTKEAYKLSVKHDISMPITTEVHRVLYEGCTPLEAVKNLLNRSPSNE